MGITSERHCDICNIGFSTELSLKEHRLSLMHHKILNHQLRSQGVVDPEHYCFLCQKSLFFSAWADHLLDRSHRQKVFSMKAEESSHQSALHALAARSPWNPLVGPEHSISRSASTASLGESRHSASESLAAASDGHHSDLDWWPSKAPAGRVSSFDRETESLIRRTQALLKKRQASKPRPIVVEEEEEEEMTPVSSLQSTERSDWRSQQDQQALSFDTTASQNSNCSNRPRARRRAARKGSRSNNTKKTPIIEPIVRLTESAAVAATSSAFEALLAAEERQQPFQFGRNGGPADFNFRLSKGALSGPPGGAVARMEEAVRLSKAEEATRSKIAQCDLRLDDLNSRVEQLLALIAAEEDKKERFRMEEAALHSRRMWIIKSICGPHEFSRGSQEEEIEEEEEEEEELSSYGFESTHSESPVEPLESAVQDLQIGDQTCRDILSKVMERRRLVEEEEGKKTPKKLYGPMDMLTVKC